MKSLIQAILRLLRRDKVLPPPTIEKAWERMHQMCEDYNDLCFYISQIKDIDAPQELLKYMEKADYHMLSTRDELKIIMDRRKEHERIKERLRRGNQDSPSRVKPNHIGPRRAGGGSTPSLPSARNKPLN